MSPARHRILGDPWQFWNGTAWSGNPAASARLLSGVGTNYSVQRVGTEYVLVTQESSLIFDPAVRGVHGAVADRAVDRTHVLLPGPGAAPGSPKIVYDAQLHPASPRPASC